nr:hypothetical protein [Saprospiraceae bacterium]
MRKRLPRTITTLASLPFITPMLSTSSWQVLKWATVVWMMVMGGGDVKINPASLEFASCGTTGVTISLYSQEDVNSFGSSLTGSGCNEYLGNIYICDECSSGGSPITDLDGLSGLTIIHGYLDIRNNPGLTSLSAFNNLTSVGQYLRIWYNTSVINISGFNALSTITSEFLIANNTSLQSISGFTNLSSVGSYLQIYDNDLLSDLSIASSTSLTIGQNLYVNYNAILPDLDGFSTVNSIGGSLQIYQNPQLADCCGIYQLIQLSSPSGYNIYSNAAGCQGVNDITNQCAYPSGNINSASNTTICAGLGTSVNIDLSDAINYSGELDISVVSGSGSASTYPFTHTASSVDQVNVGFSIPAIKLPNASSNNVVYQIGWVSLTNTISGNMVTAPDPNLTGFVQVTVYPKPNISISAPPAGPVCPGTTISFDVSQPNSVGGNFNWDVVDESMTLLTGPGTSGTNVAYGSGAVSTDL